MDNVSWDTAALLLVEQPDVSFVQLARERGGTIVTNDAHLRAAAEEQGVTVRSTYELAIALQPKVRRGDELEVKIAKPGKNANEAIAYLEDGTMIVVEHARQLVGATITIQVTGVLQTAAGKMVFALPK